MPVTVKLTFCSIHILSSFLSVAYPKDKYQAKSYRDLSSDADGYNGHLYLTPDAHSAGCHSYSPNFFKVDSTTISAFAFDGYYAFSSLRAGSTSMVFLAILQGSQALELDIPSDITPSQTIQVAWESDVDDPPSMDLFLSCGNMPFIDIAPGISTASQPYTVNMPPAFLFSVESPQTATSSFSVVSPTVPDSPTGVASKKPVGAIVGGVLGGILTLLILVWLCLYRRRGYQRRRNGKTLKLTFSRPLGDKEDGLLQISRETAPEIYYSTQTESDHLRSLNSSMVAVHSSDGGDSNVMDATSLRVRYSERSSSDFRLPSLVFNLNEEGANQRIFSYPSRASSPTRAPTMRTVSVEGTIRS
ncbi:hypothetical protein H0H92_015242 [Tricholoma furcatifolium]|nr:hypothetical protein H0H92_015242 [Tricholoma furcatifolium]